MRSRPPGFVPPPPRMIVFKRGWPTAFFLRFWQAGPAAYDYDEVRALLQAHGFVAHIRSRGEKTKEKKSAQQARRWVVERAHSWFNRFRSILTRWSKKADNYLGMLYFVCGMTAYRAAGFFG